MYSKILRNIIFPLYQIRLRQDEKVTFYMDQLEKTQWWSLSDIQKLQFKRLKKIMIHANENVPYYHKMFKKINFNPNFLSNLDDLNKLPIITKDVIQNNFDEMYARNFSKENLISSSTGGSTGIPLKFFIDKRWGATNMATAYRSWGWAGYKPGDKMAYIWSARQDLNNSKFSDKMRNYFLKIKKLDAFNMNEEKMMEYVKILSKFRPKIINSYSSAMYIFSEFLNKIGNSDINPKAILTTADMLYYYKRKSIQKTFICDVFDYYSGRETSLQAAECSEHNGYHLSIENAIVEFIKGSEHVSSGETGKIIITDLWNYAMPLIRYEIGDLGVPSDETCSCGRKLPLMESIKGRILDTIITPKGKILSGMSFPSIFADYDIKGIKEFQIIQKRINKLLIKLVKGKEYNKKDLDLYIDIIKKTVGDEMEIEIQFVDKIDPTKSGKHRPVISEIEIDQIKI
jgi:phenylacetate-CoA ligase